VLTSFYMSKIFCGLRCLRPWGMGSNDSWVLEVRPQFHNTVWAGETNWFGSRMALTRHSVEVRGKLY